MTRGQFAALGADPVAYAAGLGTDDLTCLYAALRHAMGDPAWPGDAPEADERVMDALASELARRGALRRAQRFFAVNRAEAGAMARRTA